MRRHRAVTIALASLLMTTLWAAESWAQSGEETRTGLSSEQIRSAMTANRMAARECVFQATDTLPGQLEMVVEFQVDPDGEVRRASMHESNTGSGQVDGCIVDLMSQIDFPQTEADQPIGVRYRYFFVTGG